MKQAGEGAYAIADEVRGRVTRQGLDRVAQEFHGVGGVVGAAIADARDVVDQRAELLLALPQLGLHAPPLRDVGADADDAAFRRPAVGDAQPAVAGQLQFEAAFADAMAPEPLLDPALGIGRGLRVLAARDGVAHDLLEGAAGRHEIAAHGEELAVAAVAGHQALVGIPQDEAFAHALQGVGEPHLRALQLVLDVAPLGDVEDDAVAIDRLAGVVEHALPALEHASARRRPCAARGTRSRRAACS